MNTEVNLIESVQELLRSKYNIHVSIPPLCNLIDTKINLKMPASALPSEQNRYRALIALI